MKLKFFLSSAVMFMTGGLISFAYAGGGEQTLGQIAETAVTSIAPIVDLIVAICYVAGIGFAGAGILKFKQHKENPAQVPLGTCFMLLFIGISLVWLPTLIKSTGATIFGTGAQTGSSTGGDIFESGSGG